jgi:hypothetical protein
MRLDSCRPTCLLQYAADVSVLQQKQDSEVHELAICLLTGRLLVRKVSSLNRQARP